jgi:DNA polymerase III sliding clamp (beta) subunit (PCNA family)
MKTEIQLPMAELKPILPGLSKVIQKHSSLPVLGCVRVERNQKGEVILQATNLEDYVTVRLSNGEGPEAAFLVPFEVLAKAIKSSAKDAVITLIQDKTETKLRTYIGDNPIDQKLEAPEVQEWPSVPPAKEYGLMLEEGFKPVFCQALECVSIDPSRLILNGVCLDVSDPNAHHVVATDGRVLFSANSFHFDLKESLVIPSRNFLGWHSFWEDGVCTLAVIPCKDKELGWVQLQSEHWTFITRQIEGEYPHWKQIVPQGRPDTVIQLNAEAIDALEEVVPKLPGEESSNSPIVLAVNDNELTVEGRLRENDPPITIPIRTASVSGQSTAIQFNRHYLLQALKLGLTEIDVVNGSTPIVCKTDGKQLLFAPLVLNTNNHNEERTDMSKKDTNESTEEPVPESAIRIAMQQIEKIKETLRGVITDFNEVLAVLKTTEKEHKATEREIESVRNTLRTIQSVRI